MKDFLDWKKEVLRHVRFFFDHEEIEKELTAHYEDSVQDFERIGYDEELARTRALAAMGDAVEVGKGLDRAHKPWLGWLFEATKWMMTALALILAVAVIVVTVVTDYIVCGTVTTIVTVPIYMGIAGHSFLLAGILLIGTAVILYKHRENFPRMLNGTELGLRSAIRGDNKLDKQKQ